ncbi:M56 family metallopeptidase protein [Pedobacter rhodius]|uniref:TonB family protein n=1 Tax=Pedobacter rhodius TaxID=3004098 RepID=A0ABT4KXP3_9SPHI|nr:M56 family metallopeptidase protein [Pedobacter sp. SJ11]MCZ4223702.1 TonB family protein [Pedobacter sp. SJ11]
MSFAHYLLQVNLYLIVFYGFYKLLLDKETYFTLNRFYLVTAGILSLSIPFIRLEWLTEQKAAQQVYTTVKWDAVLQQATIVTEGHEGFNWGNLLVYVYCGGILFFLCRLIYNLLVVNKLIRKAKEGSAFSFFGRKVIDLDLPKSDVIDSHEEAHIKQWHTLDILFFELIGIITWLNPVIYFYKKTIKNIHEFLADEHAAEFQGDKAEYAMLILSKSFGINPNALTSNFFDKSLIKKRIYMLHKERSKKTAVLKYGISIPLFAIFIVFSSATVRKNQKLFAFSEQIPLEQPIKLVEELVSEPIKSNDTGKNPAKIVVHSVPVERDWKDFYNFLGKTIIYPKDAQESDLQGNALIKFTLRNGKVSDLSTNADLGKGCDEEVMKAILSYKGFKEVENGKYALKVAFRLDGSEAGIQNEAVGDIKGYEELAQLNVTGFAPSATLAAAEEVNKEKVYDFVSIEKVPEFPGGMKKFNEYLSKSIKYPEAAQDNNVQGKVWLSFTVEKNGALSDIIITRGLGSGTDEEAKRVLEKSPKWTPGIQNGKAVRVKYNININFKLDTENEKPKPVTENSKLTSISIKDIEGKNSPLVILDGIAQKKDALKYINPETIESISVLKDASAYAIYGSKSVNGVILITSKASKNSIFKKPEHSELTIDNSSNHTVKTRL